jgi:phosphate transport system substrate-binding protein
MKRKTFLAAIVTAFIATVPAASWAVDAQKLDVTGASTIAPLMAEIGKRFEKANPGVRIDVQTGGSSRGVADARSGIAQIGMVSRPLKADETDLTAYPVARDGVAITLNKANPVKTLTDDQVRAIYTGKVTNWKDVGGLDKPITVVNKAEGRSTLDLFLSYYGLKNSEIKSQVIIGDNQQEIKTVSGNPNSIGYVSIGSAEFEIKNGTPLKVLPTQGVEATVENVRNGRFPLSRPLNLVTKGPAIGLAKKVIDFAQSKSVNDLIEAQYFVPLVR